ncbi:precorrin-6y C5,15-methyltransferase (decarboxylating) subunit CbiE [Vallicoccus soli]|uniref:Precorrin-6y C5,15-methyltransferase (Decarboxylating) subunit CbiE n=1 Tax=Vallicoccus soli TaxID=2339232 RepID=A0A3A3YN05_9ACTN|nr:precorrin-6y C5,15-methyltransferase (decarboxylating) subunit CbiE [Vallicoccus soli]RJK92769.1 precorrin-6y C5,15-methyltransferase (decarboxylating) subunit CbiE [Vallicoccus soli]
MITVVGLDGGALAPAAAQALAGAALVVGGRRHLEAVGPVAGRTVAMGDLAGALDAVDAEAAAGGDVVVLASGDPGWFGVLRALRARGHAPAVLPAVSSVALAFARAGVPWDDAVVVSAHGRDPRTAVNACLAARTVAVLTAPGAGPALLGAALRGSGRSLVVAEGLGGPYERVTRCTPEEAAARDDWREPNVVLSLAPRRTGRPGPVVLAGPPTAPDGWALPEDAYEHRGAMVTKAEVRALALARLAPRLGTMVWDVGAGSGSVGVECARFGAAVVAVERDAEQCARTARNAAAHDVDVRVVHGEAPEALAGLPAPDAVFVGGGGPEVVAACAAAGPRRVVVTLATLERLAPTRGALLAGGFSVEGAMLHSSRLEPLPGAGGASRLAALNPVLVLWGARP